MSFDKYLLEGRKAGLKDLAIVEKEIARAYLEASKAVTVQLEEFYAKGFTPEQARLYGRLANLQKGIIKEYQKLTSKIIPMAETSSADAYIESFKHFEFGLDKSESLNLAWGMPPVEAVRASVYSVEAGFDLIKTFRKNADIRISQLQGAITRGIIQGTGLQKTADSIKGLFENGYNDAIRVVRTEQGRNWTEGFLEAHNKAIGQGIDAHKMWVATLDGRTRVDHGLLDGQMEDKNGNFHMAGVTYRGPGLSDGGPETVINCRCTLIDIIDGIPPEIRRAGQDEIKYTTYNDWARSKGWTPERGWPKVKKI